MHALSCRWWCAAAPCAASRCWLPCWPGRPGESTLPRVQRPGPPAGRHWLHPAAGCGRAGGAAPAGPAGRRAGAARSAQCGCSTLGRAATVPAPAAPGQRGAGAAGWTRPACGPAQRQAAHGACEQGTRSATCTCRSTARMPCAGTAPARPPGSAGESSLQSHCSGRAGRGAGQESPRSGRYGTRAPHPRPWMPLTENTHTQKQKNPNDSQNLFLFFFSLKTKRREEEKKRTGRSPLRCASKGLGSENSCSKNCGSCHV